MPSTHQYGMPARPPQAAWAASRTPMHPGRFLDTRYLQPSGLSQQSLARALGISRRRVNELICGKRPVTPDTAVRLARYFHTDVALWLQLQFAWDVYHARRLCQQRQA